MDAVRRFHRRRQMFFYRPGDLVLAKPRDPRTHYEWMRLEHGIEESEAAKLTRGYYLDGKIVLYRGEFQESEAIVKELEQGLMYILIGMLDPQESDEVWMGATPGVPGEVWKPKTFIGTCRELGKSFA